MIKAILSICIVLFLLNSGYAQQGVNYYSSNNSMLPGSRATDIIEQDNGNLLILATCTDKDYKEPHAGILNISSNGTQLYFNILDQISFYDIHGFNRLSNNNYKIFGNFTINKIFKPQFTIVDTKGRIIDSQTESVVYSTHLEDVLQTSDFEALLLYTKNSKADLFNINLNMISLLDNKVQWLKQISSEQNEEADMVITVDNGDLLVLGKKYNDEKTDYVPVIYRLNSKGDLIWKKGITVPANMYMQSIAKGNSGEIVYSCGYTNNPTGFAETRIMKFDKNGEQQKYEIIDDFSMNGMIQLSESRYLLYGSKFDVDQKQIVNRAKYVLVDYSLRPQKTDNLTIEDKPDVDAGNIKTSSEFLTACILKNGKIALGGKVFMPQKKGEIPSKSNVLLVIIDDKGNILR